MWGFDFFRTLFRATLREGCCDLLLYQWVELRLFCVHAYPSGSSGICGSGDDKVAALCRALEKNLTLRSLELRGETALQ